MSDNAADNATENAPENVADRLRARWRRWLEREAKAPTPKVRPTPSAPLPDSLLAQPLLADLSPSEAAILGLFVRRETAEVGQTIVRQGDRGDALFLIEAGEAEVRAHAEDGTVATVATLGPGQYFGEIALVGGGPRNADVVALTPMTLLRLDRPGYELLSQAAAAEDLARTAHRRAEETQARLATASDPAQAR